MLLLLLLLLLCLSFSCSSRILCFRTNRRERDEAQEHADRGAGGQPPHQGDL